MAGVDPAREGNQQAARSYANLRLHLGSAYDDLVGQLETVSAPTRDGSRRAVYAPREYVQTSVSLLDSRGLGDYLDPRRWIYHSGLAATGKTDRHFTAVWGHILVKFWSKRTPSFSC